jgi:hypothetical protein
MESVGDMSVYPKLKPRMVRDVPPVVGPFGFQLLLKTGGSNVKRSSSTETPEETITTAAFVP